MSIRPQLRGLRVTFNRYQRLLEPAEFKAVFDRNKVRAGNAAFLLLVLPNQLDHSRLGLVVGKKALKSAVDRNRVKRIVRDRFRHFSFATPVDVIFLARPGIAGTDKESWSRRIPSEFDKINWQLTKLAGTG